MMKQKKITIIGGSGGMGKVFGRYFNHHGSDVTIHARNKERLKVVATEIGVNYESSLEESVKQADIVMVTIPISSTPELIKKIGPYLKENALIFDITSLKKAVFEALVDLKNTYPVNVIITPFMFKIFQNKNSLILVVTLPMKVFLLA